jgi:protein kinase C substrate 80K-H
MRTFTKFIINLLLVINLCKIIVASASDNEQEIKKTRGVHPKDLSKYQHGDTFTCVGNNEMKNYKTIPLSSINDDFCDCTLDGSDEPGTSACSYLKPSRFYCKANPSKSFYIYTSRVDDGICDCCDGEDELKTECPNNCKELARTILESKKEKALKFMEGLKIRETYVKKAKEQLNHFVEERKSLQRQTESVDINLPKLEEIAIKYRKVEESYKNQLVYQAEMNYVHKIKLQKFDLNTLRTILLPNLCIQGEKSGMEALMEQYKIDIFVEETNNSTIYKLFQQFINEPTENSEIKEDVAFHLIDLIIATKEEKNETSTMNYKIRRNLLLHHLMEIAKKTSNLEYLALISLEEYENIQSKLEKEQSKNQNALQTLFNWVMKKNVKEYDGTVENYAKKLSLSLKNAGQKFKHSMALSSQSQYDYAKNIKNTILNDFDNLVKMSKTDFGEGNAFLSLYNECFSKKSGKYTYNICPFKSADQDGTRLGNFDSLYSNGGSGKANMIYKNGLRCPGGQQRELNVVFYCGKENDIFSVKEPSPCSYVAKFESPAICGEAEKKFVENVKTLLADAGLSLES